MVGMDGKEINQERREEAEHTESLQGVGPAAVVAAGGATRDPQWWVAQFRSTRHAARSKAPSERGRTAGQKKSRRREK